MARKKKHTVVYTGLFGEKHVETRWEPETGCGFIIVLLLGWFFLRGCS